MPQKVWAVGEEVLAADFNTYAQNQVVPAFTGTTQRDAQWASPPAGALCVTTDTNTLWQRVGSAWSTMQGRQLGYQDAPAFSVGGTPINMCSIAFTLTAPRIVGLAGSGFATKSAGEAAGIGVCQYLIDSGTPVGRAQNFNIATSSNVTFAINQRVNLAAGAHTARLQVYTTVSTMTVACCMTVDDMGPQ